MDRIRLREIIYEMMLCSSPNAEDIKMSQDVKAMVQGKVQIIQMQSVNSPRLIKLGVEALKILDGEIMGYPIMRLKSPKAEQIKGLLEEGRGVKEIAGEVGVSESYVRLIKSKGGK